MVSCTWIAINSVNNTKIVLRPLEPPGPIGPFLQLFFSVKTLIYTWTYFKYCHQGEKLPFIL